MRSPHFLFASLFLFVASAAAQEPEIPKLNLHVESPVRAGELTRVWVDPPKAPNLVDYRVVWTVLRVNDSPDPVTNTLVNEITSAGACKENELTFGTGIVNGKIRVWAQGVYLYRWVDDKKVENLQVRKSPSAAAEIEVRGLTPAPPKPVPPDTPDTPPVDEVNFPPSNFNLEGPVYRWTLKVNLDKGKLASYLRALAQSYRGAAAKDIKSVKDTLLALKDQAKQIEGSDYAAFKPLRVPLSKKLVELNDNKLINPSSLKLALVEIAIGMEAVAKRLEK